MSGAVREAWPLSGTVNATITGGQTAQWNDKTGTNSTDALGAGSTKFSTGSTTTVSYSLSASTAFTYADILVTSAPDTAAEFASFNVKGYNGGQHLEWKTAREVGNIGFNVYRNDAGKLTRLNSGLLAGSALTVGVRTTLGVGKSYTWWDAAPASKQTQYWLEERERCLPSNSMGLVLTAHLRTLAFTGS